MRKKKTCCSTCSAVILSSHNNIKLVYSLRENRKSKFVLFDIDYDGTDAILEVLLLEFREKISLFFDR